MSRDCIRLRDRGGGYIDLWWASARGAPKDRKRVSRVDLERALREGASDPFMLDGIVEVLKERGVLSAHFAWPWDAREEMVREELGALIRSGSVFGVEVERKTMAVTPRKATREKPAPAPIAPREGLSFYEIRLVDEMEKPITGVRFSMHTPAASVTRKTDGAGMAHVNEKPHGIGRASVISVKELHDQLKGRAEQPRRTKRLPAGEEWHVVSLGNAIDSVTVPDAKVQRLMIVTRTDLYGYAIGWGELSLAEVSGPWVLCAGDDAVVKLHADATRREVIVHGEARELPSFDEPKEDAKTKEDPPPVWLKVDVDWLHEALLEERLDDVFAFLRSLPQDPPELEVVAPPVEET
jgi:hypothetical protein